MSEYQAIVSDTLRVLLAALLAEEAGYGGVLYLAVGAGNPTWDTTGTPQPDPDQDTLLDELAREAVTVVYLDESGAEVAGPTRFLKISATFDIGEANGTWREEALFGGTATSSPDSGLVVGLKNFPALEKPAGGEDFAITRTWKLTL